MKEERIDFIRDFGHLTYYVTDSSTGNSFIESGKSIDHLREKLEMKSIDPDKCNIGRIDQLYYEAVRNWNHTHR
jgi:hypothetical protein